MTRKRFIKLLMASGYSRNEAQDKALYVRQCGKSYADVYRAVFPMKELVVKWATSVSEATRSFVDAAKKIVAAMGAGLLAFSEAFCESLNAEGEHERYTSNDQAAPGVLCLPQDGD